MIKEVLEKAYKEYSEELRAAWTKLLDKYKFDEATVMDILDGWDEPDNAEAFVDDWNKVFFETQSDKEKKFGVNIDHDECWVVVSKDNLKFDGETFEEEK